MLLNLLIKQAGFEYLKKAKCFALVFPHKFSTASFKSNSSQHSFLIPFTNTCASSEDQEAISNFNAGEEDISSKLQPKW